MKVLRARVADKFRQEAQTEYDATRKSQLVLVTVQNVSVRTIIHKTV